MEKEASEELRTAALFAQDSHPASLQMYFSDNLIISLFKDPRPLYSLPDRPPDVILRVDKTGSRYRVTISGDVDIVYEKNTKKTPG